MVDKVVRDGKVAVIVSPGYGAGWSTWASNPEQAAFDPGIVEWIENGKEGDPPAGDNYAGGLRNATIQWIPQGTMFRIDEYDGSEYLIVFSPDLYYTA